MQIVLNVSLSNNCLKAILLGLFTLAFTSVSAQKWEVGGSIGGANYSGDLARRIVLNETNLQAGILARYNFNEYFSWRPGINYLKVSGGDYNFNETQFRNLSFFSTIWELDNRIEFNFLRFGTSVLAKRMSTYVFLGLNAFYFNPMAIYGGETVELRNLGTEGQTLPGNKRYSNVNIAIPMGIGYKISLSDNWVFSVETAWRKTFTDYLDDVSGLYPDFAALAARGNNTTIALSDRSAEVAPFERRAEAGVWRGNPRYKDWFLSTGITFTYRFTPIKCGFSSF